MEVCVLVCGGLQGFKYPVYLTCAHRVVIPPGDVV